MIKTDLPEFEKELIDEINIFEDAESFNIRHLFKESENKYTNTVVVNGKAYAFGNIARKTNDEIYNNRLKKRYAKLAIYKALSLYTGKSYPWGSLTGIRPNKLARQLVEETGEFEDYFINTLKVSEAKTKVIKSIQKAQAPYYNLSNDNTDFFVFIPFCPSRCSYCSFVCADIKNYAGFVDEYVTALIEEINASKKFIRNLKSVYVGGGTPVSLSNENLEKVLIALSDIAKGVEFTVEAGRPDCITKENLSLLKKYGVNRICINPQTFSDQVLNNIGRKHTAKQTEEVFNLAKGDFIVNMDFIAGLKGETLESFKAGIDKAIALAPDNITVHTLAIKRGADLAKETQRVQAKEVENMVEYAYSALTQNGYNPYYLYRQKYMANNLENIGYSKAGKECVYNVNTMEEISSTVACGANAISKRVFATENRIEREASPKDVKTYLSKLNLIMQNKEKLFN